MTKQSLILAALFAGLLSLSTVQAAESSHYLADRHVERGATCESCHGAKTPKPGATVSTKQCSSCHGSLDEVAKRTAGLDPNPHYNHLVGLNCTECHRGHQQSVNMCASCHNLKFKVP